MSRIHKNFESGWTSTPNEILNSPELSFKAKGIWGYINSKPADWEFSIAGIAKQAKDSFDSIRSGLKELENLGLLKRVQKTTEQGRFTGYDYILSDKIDTNSVIGKSHDGFSHDGETLTSNNIESKNILSNINKKKTEDQIRSVTKFNAFDYLDTLDIDSTLKETVKKWLEVRKAKKAATTQHAIDLALKQVMEWENDISKQIQIFNNSIISGWTGVFQLKKAYADNSKSSKNPNISIKKSVYAGY
jgi:predicted transcriptional regulator